MTEDSSEDAPTFGQEQQSVSPLLSFLPPYLRHGSSHFSQPCALPLRLDLRIITVGDRSQIRPASGAPTPPTPGVSYSHEDRHVQASSPRLPQELIDQIIDELESDFDALQACSLAASAWLPRSRRHLFRSISLNPNNYATVAQRFSSTNLSSHVHRLWISAGDRDDDELPIPRDDELSVPLLSCFRNVTIVELHNMRWDMLRPDVQWFFLTRYTSVTTLDLYDVEFHDLDDLLRLLCGFSRVRSLHLCRVWWETGLDTGTGSPCYTMPKSAPCLRELMLYETSSSASFLSGLYRDGDSTVCQKALRKLALDWADGEDLAVLNDLIQSAGTSLRTLELDLSWHAPVAPLNFSQNTNLRGIWLDGLLLDSPNSPSSLPSAWLPAILNTITSPHIIQFVFYIFLGDTDGLQLIDMERLDAVFSGSQFQRLQVVAWIVTMLPHPDWRLPSRSDVQEVVKRRMPSTSRRGILRFRSHELLTTI